MTAGQPYGNGHRRDEDEVTRLRTLNAEMRRLLDKHQWSGIAPAKSYGACPECGGSAAPFAEGHRRGCALAAALRSSRPLGGAAPFS